MSDREWATLIGFLVFVGLRVLDYVLPKGRYFRWVSRFSVPDDEGDKGDGKG